MMTDEAADRVVFSYRAAEVDPTDPDTEWVLADSGWIRAGLEEPSYRRYLRLAHPDPLTVGEEWTEFVNCGCASPRDVVLRVEAIEGGRRLDPGTSMAFVSRRDVPADPAPA